LEGGWLDRRTARKRGKSRVKVKVEEEGRQDRK